MGKEAIKVYCRIRPCLKKEEPTDYVLDQDFEQSRITFKKERHLEYGPNSQKEEYTFKFNGILDTKSQQDQVFDTCAKQCVMSALEGYNSTIFCYGQTGSGKTYTMTGAETVSFANRGIIPRALETLFNEINQRQGTTDRVYEVNASYIEIYNDDAYDLLSDEREKMSERGETDMKKLTRLQIRKTNSHGDFEIKNLKLHHVSSEEEAMDLVWRGSCNRNFTATLMNENSSRSHCIFSMVVRSQGSGDADEKMRVSKLHLVDLAGSERVGKSGSEGKALTEAKNINLSLHHLVRVIDALAKGDEHIPYRDSTMTMFLRDSLGGNCKTAMIANINPCIDHLEETISTCRFAQTVASVKQESLLNERVDDQTLIRQLKRRVKELEEELAFFRSGDKERGALDAQESSLIKEKVNEYIDNPDKNAHLNLGGDIIRIRGAFALFKDLILYERKKGGSQGTSRHDHATVHAEPTPQKPKHVASPTTDVAKSNDGLRMNKDVEQQIKMMAAGIEQRDIEIDILVSMLQKKNSKRCEMYTQTEAPTSNGYSAPSRQNGFEPSRVETNTPARIPVETVSQKSVMERIKQKQEAIIKEDVKITNEKLEKIANNVGMIDRAKAFEQFRRQYRHNEAIEKRKQDLEAKFKTAKKLGAAVAEQTKVVDKYKMELVQLQVENQTQGGDNEVAIEVARDRILEQKKIYDSMVAELRSFKTEIEYGRKQMDAAQQKLAQEFSRWHRTTYPEGHEDEHAQPSANETSMSSTSSSLSAPQPIPSRSIDMSSSSTSSSTPLKYDYSKPPKSQVRYDSGTDVRSSVNSVQSDLRSSTRDSVDNSTPRSRSGSVGNPKKAWGEEPVTMSVRSSSSESDRSKRLSTDLSELRQSTGDSKPLFTRTTSTENLNSSISSTSSMREKANELRQKNEALRNTNGTTNDNTQSRSLFSKAFSMARNNA